MADNVRFLTANDGRDKLGRFAPGKGNIGRPVGAKAKVSRDLLAQIKAMGPMAIQKLWEAVANGDQWAVQAVMQYTLPKDRTIAFEGATPDDITAALEAGDISAAEANQIANALAKLATVNDLDEIKNKIIELEAIVIDGAGK